MDLLVLPLSTQCFPYQTGYPHQLSLSLDQSGPWFLEVSFTRKIVGEEDSKDEKRILSFSCRLGFTLAVSFFSKVGRCTPVQLSSDSGRLLYGQVWNIQLIILLPSRTFLIHINYVNLVKIHVSTGQGNYLTLNSDGSNISRNSGVFWAVFQCRWVLK